MARMSSEVVDFRLLVESTYREFRWRRPIVRRLGERRWRLLVSVRIVNEHRVAICRLGGLDARLREPCDDLVDSSGNAQRVTTGVSGCQRRKRADRFYDLHFGYGG